MGGFLRLSCVEVGGRKGNGGLVSGMMGYLCGGKLYGLESFVKVKLALGGSNDPACPPYSVMPI